MSIWETIRLMRLAATAIRNRDFAGLWEVIKAILMALGYGEELQAVIDLKNAFATGDLNQIVSGLQNLVDIIAGAVKTPAMDFAPVDSVDAIAARLDANADHLMMHCGHRGSTAAQLAETPASKAAVSPTMILVIIQAILAAAKWWRDRQKEELDTGAFETNKQ